MTVMTSPDNPEVTRLSFADLYALTGPQSQGFDKWSSATTLAKSLGSNTVFPDTDLSITGPGEESGTYDSYVELVITPIASKQTPPAESATRPDYVASANDNAIIAGVEGSPSPLGWVGFAYAQENKDKIKDLGARRRTARASQPSDATIADGFRPAFALASSSTSTWPGCGQPGRRGLRRLLSRRWHDLKGPRDRPVRGCRRQTLTPRGRPGKPANSLSPPRTGRASSEWSGRFRLPSDRTLEGLERMSATMQEKTG